MRRLPTVPGWADIIVMGLSLISKLTENLGLWILYKTCRCEICRRFRESCHTKAV